MAMCLMMRTKMMMMEIMMMTCCEKIKMSREPPNGKHQPASHHCVIGVIGPENEYNQFEIQRYQRPMNTYILLHSNQVKGCLLCLKLRLFIFFIFMPVSPFNIETCKINTGTISYF